jgi:pimeloyl-ACP methyl ester carboxylesterase
MPGACRLRHGRVSLALHERRAGTGRALLLLHELGGSSAGWGSAADGWPGPVFALDFAGHGDSDWLVGGAYHPELFAADADAALAATGPAAVAGRGLGAWVALLLAGGRPELVPAALALPGAGLDGGGALPGAARLALLVEDFECARRPGTCPFDPMVRLCEVDVRPVDYARTFAANARRLLLAEDGERRPPWWEAARQVPGAERVPADLPAALAALGRAGR